MLKELRISNIILVENIQISFKKGFNVLSGESGSGKSAIMEALRLLLGEKADSQLIRRGEDRAFVEGKFDIDHLPILQELLKNSGIDHDESEDLIIRRELCATGKSRSFVNHHMAHLTLLRQIGKHLIDIVGQHANQRLFSLDFHRQFLDTFGDLEEDLNNFSTSWKRQNELQKQLDQLISSEALRLRQIETCQMEIEELSQANLQDGEEEELFQEYSQLSNRAELKQKAKEIVDIFDGERLSLIPLLARARPLFEHISILDPSLQDTAHAFNAAYEELKEIGYTLRNYQSGIDSLPDRLDDLSSRLTLLSKLKRKYGATFNEMQTYLLESKKKLHTLENTDHAIEQLKEELQQESLRSEALSQILTKKRHQIAKEMQNAMTCELQRLNMPKAQFYIEVSPQKRSSFGDDRVEFLLTPNIGEASIPIKECASGGEIARIMLALQTLLAGKENIPTLIFDEIDANIGGETASIVGEKLQEIGKQHQVLCITHFPQVADKADFHMQINKIEREGRTVTTVTLLNSQTRQKEIDRMLGKKSWKTPLSSPISNTI